MGVLSNLEPASVFYYFEEICGIPHTSHHEKALSDYCVQFAKAHGLACRQDEMGNVLIKAPATPGYEKEPGLILQGHLDMVGDKTADCPLDLEKEAIHPVVDGGYVCAEGTTLGGDDGIAVAYALAVLDAKDIPHPALEVVLTVCEEVGLLGASAMDFSDLEGRILVNIDSEEEGVLTAGCAGGRRVECHLPITRAAVTGTAVKADVTGLVGGHSGTEIHKGRANAIALLGRWLTLLTENGVDYAALALSGGAKENVIPKESSITLVLPAGITEGVHTAAAQFAAQVQAEYGTADPAICLQLTEQGCGAFSALDADSTQRLRKALLLMPWGVQAMSMDVPGLVETSLNLGVAEMDEQEAILRFSIRSSVPSAKELLSPARSGVNGARRLAAQTAAANGWYYMDWLANDDNPEYHRRVTGPAIVQSIAREGKSAVDAIVIGVGSGGTVTGVGETIKAWTNDVRIAAVEPYESQALGGGLTGPHGISDLGYGFVPENFNAYVVDNVVAVNTTDAQRAAQKVLRTDAIPASVASGAVLQAAAQLIHVGASRSALAILPGRQIVNTL